ncbi:uncharacterized protein [Musca autumnalis]|uniref:uncharacterized protein n=1 Tax=Musca autumnalis TaxID=221902 RepID=UPI003CEFA6A4
MFANCCRCCLTTERLLISIYTETPHNDFKTLNDYFNTLFHYVTDGGRHGQHGPKLSINYSKQICLRCSKALQISYHFMSMTMERQKEYEERFNNANGIMGNSNEDYHDDGLPLKDDVKQQLEMYADINNNNVQQEEDVKTKIELKWNYEMENSVPEREEQTNVEEVRDNFMWNKEIKVEPTIKSEVVPTLPKLKPFKCRYCDESFEYHELLIKHTQQVHQQLIPFKCKMCNFYTCYIESLGKHYKKIHKKEDLENRLYRTKELLAISAEVEILDEITLKCTECDFQTHTQIEMDGHLDMEHNMHEEEDKTMFTTLYNCPSCYKQFMEKTSMKIHFSMAHNNPETGLNIRNNHCCENCGKIFNRRSGLVLHERFCRLNEPISCTFCPTKFYTVHKYELHLNSAHSIDVRHECEICHKVFSRSSSLTVHRRRHNERYAQCHLCSKNYINNAELQIHLQRIHKCIFDKGGLYKTTSFPGEEGKQAKNINSLKCRYCEYTSTSKFAIEIHQYRHTGKPYKCKVCSKSYVLRKDIKLHCKRSHDVEVTDEELALMFKEKHGNVSRFDAFSKTNNDQQINAADEIDLEKELKEFDLTFEDILKELFTKNDL